MLIVIINVVRQTCMQSRAQMHKKVPGVSSPPQMPTELPWVWAGLQSFVPGTWQVCERVLKICDMTSYMTYGKPFVFWEVILAARNMWGVLNMNVDIPLGCLGGQERDLWRRKECAQGVFVISGFPAAWGGAERQLGRAWLVRVRVWITPQRRGTEQEEFGQTYPKRNGGKNWVAEGWMGLLRATRGRGRIR